jgi:TolB-like protein/DNA-binding winged helix-turn-helix (wHTH) protein/Tfp pilus assembly protein PilF
MFPKIYKFGEFRLDANNRCLSKDSSEIVALTPRVFDLLLFLVESGGETVSRNELLDKVWGADTFVEEANLTQSVSVLRKALGDVAKPSKYILTVPQHGYRFVAEVGEIKRQAEIKISDSKLQIEDLSQVQALKSEKQETTEKPRTYSTFRYFVLTGFVVVAVIVFSSFLVWREPAPRKISEVKSIAVLPLQDLSAGQADKYLGIGISDALTNKLSGFQTLSVRPTNSVLRFADVQNDLANIGRELDVETVLQGNIQRDGERLRVSIQLVRTQDKTVVWAESFEDRADNIFTVQNTISGRVVRALNLSETELKSLTKDYTTNSQAYDLYLQGRFLWRKRTKADFEKAIEYYKRALELDSNFALPYIGIADCYLLLGDFAYYSPTESYPLAKENVLRALAIDADLADAQISLANIEYLYDWDWVKAENSFKKAIELAPNNATAHQWYGEFLVSRGRFDEATRELNEAIRIEPNLIVSKAVADWIFYMRGDDETAIARLRQTSELDRDFFLTHLFLALALDTKGEKEESLREYELAAQLNPDSAYCVAYLGRAYGQRGKRAEALNMLEKLRETNREKYVSPFFYTLVYEGLGEREKMFAYLEKSIAERASVVPLFRIEPHLKEIRRNVRFNELLSRVN